MGKKKGITELDVVWRTLRTWGKYQLFQLFLILLDFIPASFAILGVVFTGFIPEYSCDAPSEVNNDTSLSNSLILNAKKCHFDVISLETNETESKACHKFSFANENSYSYEWNLVCSRANLAALAQSLVLAGQGIGALIMSHLSDRFGRRTIHVLSHVAVLCCMITMAFSKNIYMLLVLQLVTGSFQQGIVCTSHTIVLEIFPKEARAFTCTACVAAWSVGLMVLSLFGYLFRDINWRYLQLALAVFSLHALVEWWFMDESLRWLLSNGKLNDAKKILKKAARWNQVDYKQIEDILHRNVQLTDTENESVDEDLDNTEMKIATESLMTDNMVEKQMKTQAIKKYNLTDILKTSSLRINSFILWYTWIVGAATYFGLTLVSSHLAGNRFINFFLSGVIEIPSQVIGLFLLNRIGRKRTMILWFTVSGISLVIATVLLTVFGNNEASSIIATGFSLIGKLASTGSFGVVFLYTPEIYPTNFRNSGLGIASSIGRIGGILAPFVSNLALVAMWIPGAIFGGMCLLAVVLSFRLPESTSHELPTTIEECETWEKK